MSYINFPSRINVLRVQFDIFYQNLAVFLSKWKLLMFVVTCDIQYVTSVKLFSKWELPPAIHCQMIWLVRDYLQNIYSHAQ